MSIAHHTAAALMQRFSAVRELTEALCVPLATEDYVVQSSAECSPTKWHLGHTSWFFDQFLVAPRLGENYEPFHPQFAEIFNSYYEQVGKPFERAQRGLLARPSVDEIYLYREWINIRIAEILDHTPREKFEDVVRVLTLGLHHEQQHQELLLTDVKHLFSLNPMRPVFKELEKPALTSVEAPKLKTTIPDDWIEAPGGIRKVGFEGAGFSFDNEGPRHRVYLQDYRLRSKLVTNAEYLEFMASDGYNRPELWLAEGWNFIQLRKWTAPLYWEFRDSKWWMMTLTGPRRVESANDEPVTHISFYEADAFARWKGFRLPTEFEWEATAESKPIRGNFLESSLYHPQPARESDQFFGDVWEWTSSAYLPYPGYRPLEGPLGEYNGKFMSNQMVLRGGSCVTPADHIRSTYRNFLPPESRWQFTGIRLGETIS